VKKKHNFTKRYKTFFEVDYCSVKIKFTFKFFHFHENNYFILDKLIFYLKDCISTFIFQSYLQC
jgi:hypothetical protein